MNNARGVYPGAAATSRCAARTALYRIPSVGSVDHRPAAAGRQHRPGQRRPATCSSRSSRCGRCRPTSPTTTTDGNDAVDRGNNTTGQACLLGIGAGNVVQFATGGNIIAPQFATGRATTTRTILTDGNWAASNGNGSESCTDGQVLRACCSTATATSSRCEFLQGNIIAPQFAVFGDNNADHTALGTTPRATATARTTFGDNGFAFVTGNGNIIQIEILSDNVIAPQFALGGDNNLVVVTDGQRSPSPTATARIATCRPGNPVAGIFTVTGNGNVTQIAILSNNVWAPQIALFGPTPATSSPAPTTARATATGRTPRRHRPQPVQPAGAGLGALDAEHGHRQHQPPGAGRHREGAAARTSSATATPSSRPTARGASSTRRSVVQRSWPR